MIGFAWVWPERNKRMQLKYNNKKVERKKSDFITHDDNAFIKGEREQPKEKKKRTATAA